MATTLAKGANAGLPGSSCRITLMSPTTGIDVSAVLLREDGKVRSDSDLVFYNHPAQDGVVLDKQTVAVELAAVPGEVRTVAVVASVDPELAATHFDAGGTPHALVECGPVRLEFVPPPFVDRETVAVLIELYRRGDGWKARAVGQGWDTGLAGLASDFGIAVDDPGRPPHPSRRRRHRHQHRHRHRHRWARSRSPSPARRRSACARTTRISR
jgi:stress response protein SCP2